MSDEDTVVLKTDGLDKLIKTLKGKQPVARVGVLGSKGVRSAKGNGPSSNAVIGAAHEFGTTKLPQRSFLRVPIIEHIQAALEKSGAFDKDSLAQVLKTGSMVTWLKKVGIVAEGIVAEAFDTGGFGKWQPSDMTHKKNHQTLVETQQLRNSITSDVKE